MSAPDRAELGEAWLARRLRDHGVDVFAGTTDRDIRRERIRAAILERGLAAVVLGKGAGGKPENYLQIFERLYQQPLNIPRESTSTQG
ncbi:MAG TPA: hypothetical protein VFB54_07330 [Burkholderiales bacterium]|nr:hypothetical protein [Burkholderiales bacterium]